MNKPRSSEPEKRYDLFVTYADNSDEREWAERHLVAALKAKDFQVHSEEAFRLGVPLLEEFEHAIQQSKRILLVLSPAFFADDFEGFVDLLALSYGDETGTWPVIPLVLKPVTLPPRLRMLTQLDATDMQTWDDVLARLCKDLGRPVPGPTPIPPCPYPGMKPFTEADNRHFFGREEESDELLQRLHKRPFAAVIGPSGSGKSSLVFAGFLPKLRTSNLFGAVEWEVRTMRPGATPRHTLQATVNDMIDPATLTPRPVRNDAGLEKRFLLIIDQFEETFTQAQQAESAPFQAMLLRLIQAGAFPIILTVRADFYADLMTSPLWPEIQGRRLEIAPLDETGLRRAIQQPAESVGVYVQSALVERLVADAAGEPGVLPFVQETMRLLWEKVERRFLPLAAYETLLVLPRKAYGGPERSGLQAAIARHADATLDDLKDEQERRLAKRIFLRLIQFGEGRSDTRRQQLERNLRSADDDPARFQRVLQHLAANRLLTVSGEEEGERRVDISHEALIHGWDKLAEWVEKRRAAELVRRRLEDKATEWQRLGRAEAGLLDLVELQEAERWVNTEDGIELGCSADLSALMQRSHLFQAEQAKRQQQATYFRNGAIAAFAALSLIAVLIYQTSQTQIARQQAAATATLAQEKANAAATVEVAATDVAKALATSKMAEAQAQQQLGIAQSRQVAAVAGNRLQEDPQQALLFGLAAELITDTVEAESVVRAALDQWRSAYLLPAHTKRIPGIVYSPYGKWLATYSDDQTAKLWQLAADGQLPVPGQEPITLAHQGSVTGLVFGPDNQRVATASRDKTVRIWETGTGRLLYTLPHDDGQGVRGLLLSPDHNTLVTRSGMELRFYDLTTGERQQTLPATSNLRTLNFMFDGQLILAGADDRTIHFWHIPTGRHVQFRGFDYWIEGVQVSTDERYITVRTRLNQDATVGGTLYLYAAPKLQTAADFDRFFTPPTDQGNAATAANAFGFTLIFSRTNEAAWTSTFSPDSQRLAVGSTDGSIRVWSLNNPQANPRVLCGHTQRVEGLAFSPDSQLLASTSLDGATRLWRTESGEEVVALRTYPYYARGVRFTPNGLLLVSSDESGALHFWRAMSGSDVGFRLTTLTPPRALALIADHRATTADDGSQVVVVGEDGRIELWQPRTGETATLSAGRQRLESVAASTDGAMLAVGAIAEADKTEGQITLIDAQTGQTQRTWPAHRNGVYALAFLSDGKILASAGGDPDIQLWRTQTGERIRTLKGHTNDVRALAVSADGAWLFSAGADGTVRRWDWRVGVEKETYTVGSSLLTLAVSPDNHYLAAGGYLLPDPQDNNEQRNNIVRVWDLKTDLHYDLNHGAANVWALRFSPDGRLISGDESGRIRLWRIQEKQAVQFMAHKGWVTDLALSADGQLLYSVGDDGYVRAWPVASDAVAALACQRVHRTLTSLEWETYIAFPLDPDKLCPAGMAQAAPSIGLLQSSMGLTRPVEQPLPTIRYFESTAGATVARDQSVTVRWEVQGTPNVVDLDIISTAGQTKQGLANIGIQTFANLGETTLLRLLTGRFLFDFGVDKAILTDETALRQAFQQAFAEAGIALTDDFMLIPDVPLPGSEDETWRIISGGESYYARRDVKIAVYHARIQELRIAVQ